MLARRLAIVIPLIPAAVFPKATMQLHHYVTSVVICAQLDRFRHLYGVAVIVLLVLMFHCQVVVVLKCTTILTYTARKIALRMKGF